MPNSPRLAARCVLLLVAQTSLWTANAAAQGDEEEPPRASGLVARYFGNDGRKPPPIVVRVEAEAALAIAAHESPDSRLHPSSWSTEWRGLLDVQQPGRYQFDGTATGRCDVRLDGHSVFKTDEQGHRVGHAANSDLTIGLHKIEIDFATAAGPKQLSLRWQSDSFPQERIPARAFFHDPAETPPVDRYFLGRLTFEEHGCIKCHVATNQHSLAASLAHRPGPTLAAAAERLNAAWIYRWLDDPQEFRPEAVMPRLFSEDRRGDVERYAVASYLASLGKPIRDDVVPTAATSDRGKSLYERTGCIVCHENQAVAEDKEIPARANLRELSRKTTIRNLASFIENPSAVDPSGRMPRFGLSPEDCQAIAAYLSGRDQDTVKSDEFPPRPSAEELRTAFTGITPARGFATATADDQIKLLALKVIQEKRCANCHDFGKDLDESVRPQAMTKSFDVIAKAAEPGCLAPGSDAWQLGVPRFGISLDRAATAEFLRSTVTAPGAKSPPEDLRLTLARFNCTGCHERNGDGGLSLTLMRNLTEKQLAAESEQVRPPTLTGIAEKLRPEAMTAVLERGVRSRPWMALKMPHFMPDRVTALPALFASADGGASEPLPAVEATAELTDAGRELVGSKGFGCIKCHDLGSYVSSGTRGPDLAKVSERIQRAWYERWMIDPQRLEPGTRMPTVYFGGQSPYKHILDGDPERQRLAMWAYLSAGDKLVLPEGVEESNRNQSLASGAPLVMRTFLPGLTARSLAIRFPSQVHLAFDAQCCRLGYAWYGDFLDMGPVWTERGGKQAGITGTIFWTSVEGFPWEITPGTSSTTPDFSQRGTDLSLGAPLPDDGQVYPTRLHFRGYQLAADGPTFQYVLDLGDGRTARFDEAPRTTAIGDVLRIERQVSITASAPAGIWFCAARDAEPPTAWFQDGRHETLAAGGSAGPDAVLVVNQGGKPLWLRVKGRAPGHARWLVERQADQYVLLLNFPAAAAGATPVTIAVVKPPDGSALESTLQGELSAGGQQ